MKETWKDITGRYQGKIKGVYKGYKWGYIKKGVIKNEVWIAL